MDAEVLVKARKVFLEDNVVEYSETCPHCASKGLEKKLRYFYLSLEEAIYKCENSSCLYPFERFIFKRLSDNKNYYYEEIKDNGRELFFRVPMDGQGIKQSRNPLSTKLFCDSQKNPDIESYDCDFSDLFDDIDFEPQTEPTEPSTSTMENPDFLEFLGDTTPNTEMKVLDDNGISTMINDMLTESPLKPVNPKTTIKTESIKPKPEATLSKCIEHIEKKVQKSKIQKISEKSQETFAAVLKKARSSQNQVKSETPAAKSELRAELKFKPNDIKKVASTSKLRPTELARRLKSLDISKANSNFLRQYMQAKEDQLFANEPTQRLNFSLPRTISTPKTNSILQIVPSIAQKTAAQATSPATAIGPATETVTVTAATVQSVSTDTKTIAARKSTTKKVSTETSQPTTEKKPRKPRAKKPKKVADDSAIESANQNAMPDSIMVLNGGSGVEPKTKEIKLPTTKRVYKRKESTEQPLKSEAKNEVNSQAIQPKKNSRKKNSSSVTNDESNTTKDEKSSSVPKKSRKRKCDTDSSQNEQIDVEKPKPKRSRAKPKNSMQIELQSLPILLDETVDETKTDLEGSEVGPNVSFGTAENTAIEEKCRSTSASSGPSTGFESEESSGPLFGFSPQQCQVEVEVEMEVEVPLVSRKVTSTITDSTAQLISVAAPATKKNNKRNSKMNDKTNNISTRVVSKRPLSPTPKAIECLISKPRLPKARKTYSAKNGSQKNKSVVPHIDSAEAAQAENCFLVELDNDKIYVSKESSAEDSTNATQTETHDGNDIETCYVLPILDKKQQSKPDTDEQFYYHRKNFRKEREQSFEVDNILGDWDDSESEPSESQRKLGLMNLCSQSTADETDDVISVISVASETSGSSIAFCDT